MNPLPRLAEIVAFKTPVWGGYWPLPDEIGEPGKVAAWVLNLFDVDNTIALLLGAAECELYLMFNFMGEEISIQLAADFTLMLGTVTFVLPGLFTHRRETYRLKSGYYWLRMAVGEFGDIRSSKFAIAPRITEHSEP